MINSLSAALQAPFRLLLRALAEIQSYTLLSTRAIANVFTRPIYVKEIVSSDGPSGSRFLDHYPAYRVSSPERFWASNPKARCDGTARSVLPGSSWLSH